MLKRMCDVCGAEAGSTYNTTDRGDVTMAVRFMDSEGELVTTDFHNDLCADHYRAVKTFLISLHTKTKENSDVR